MTAKSEVLRVLLAVSWPQDQHPQLRSQVWQTAQAPWDLLVGVRWPLSLTGPHSGLVAVSIWEIRKGTLTSPSGWKSWSFKIAVSVPGPGLPDIKTDTGISIAGEARTGVLWEVRPSRVQSCLLSDRLSPAPSPSR